MWTLRQRQGLVLILGVLVVAGAVICVRNPVYVPDPPPEPAGISSLADRVDPNTADAATLAVVPGLGPKRASEIVAYRRSELEKHPERPVFRTPEDLRNVHGIGPATVENIARYMMFPTTQP